MPATTVSARIDSDLKTRAEAIMDVLGISHSTAINALYSQIVLRKGLPFELRIPDVRDAEAPMSSDAGACPQARPEGGRADANSPILSLDEIRSHVCELARSYGLQRVSLFGSYARGEASADSDIDLHVDKGEARGLALGGFQDELSRVLGKDVDVVLTTGAAPALLARIAEDEVLLYER